MPATRMHPPHPRRLLEWWTDDPANPGRATLANPAVQQLAAAIAPGGVATDLGGTMSLNVRIEPAGLVLRVHEPFESRRRLLAVQAVRSRLAKQGLLAPVPLEHDGSTLFRCGGDRWAELEAYLPNEKPTPTPAAYAWLFAAMGRLHRALAALELTVPRPLIATYAPPGSLRRWLPITEAAVQNDAEAREIVRFSRCLLRQLRELWVPATRLPRQLVHGDVRLGNVCRSPSGDTIYLDFGFLAVRPRIHELAYSLAFMALAVNDDNDPAQFAWTSVAKLVQAYEGTAAAPLSEVEHEALAAYTAAVPLYFAATAGLTNNAADQLRERLPFLRTSEWLLAHPRAMAGG